MRQGAAVVVLLAGFKIEDAFDNGGVHPPYEPALASAKFGADADEGRVGDALRLALGEVS